MKIQKNIFICWDDKNVLDHPSPLIFNGLRNLRDLNPEWNISINDKDDVTEYLKNTLSPQDFDLIKDKHIVEKCDLWRLYKIYNEGGLYVDIDRFCNISLSNIIDDNTLCVLPTYLDHDFSQDFMLSASGNPIYQQAIELILSRRNMGHNDIYFLGPQTYMHAVTKVLCGVEIDTNPGPQVFEQIRNQIKQYSFIKTYRETPPNDTVIYKNKDQNLNMEELKKEFYHSYKINHWTGTW